MKRAQLDTVGGKRPKVKRKHKHKRVQRAYAQLTRAFSVTKKDLLEYLGGRIQYSAGLHDVAMGKASLAGTTMVPGDTRRKSEMEYQTSQAAMRLRELVILKELRGFVLRFKTP